MNPVIPAYATWNETALDPCVINDDGIYKIWFGGRGVDGFAIGYATSAQLVVYDLTGREVARLVDEQRGAGDYSVLWDAADQPSGIYLYRLTAGSYTEVRKMVLLK